MENKLFEDKALNILNRLEVLKSMYLRSEDYESLKVISDEASEIFTECCDVMEKDISTKLNMIYCELSLEAVTLESLTTKKAQEALDREVDELLEWSNELCKEAKKLSAGL